MARCKQYLLLCLYIFHHKTLRIHQNGCDQKTAQQLWLRIYKTDFKSQKKTLRPFLMHKIQINVKDALPIYDAIIVMRPNFQAVTVTWRDMTQNVHLFTFKFSALQFID